MAFRNAILVEIPRGLKSTHFAWTQNKTRLSMQEHRRLQNDGLLTPEVIEHIGHVANRMLRTSNLGESDRADLIQEMSLAVIKAGKSFDPSKGSLVTFTNCVIERTRKNIYRHRINTRRDVPSIPLVESKEEGSEGVSLDELLLSEESEDRKQDLRDVWEIVSTLSGDLRKACDFILVGNSCEKTARLMGIPPTTFRRKILPALRKHFIDGGFGE